jgi:hypothetical protein
MTWSSRTVSPEEKAAFLRRFGVYPETTRHGVISTVAYYGVYLILIPMMGGGLLGSILKLLGLSESPAYLTGVTLATVASALIFWRQRRAEKHEREDWRRRRTAVEAIEALPTYTLHVAKIWLIESEPDSPAYLLRDPDRRLVLLCTDQLQFTEPDFAREDLEIILAPPQRQHVLGLRWSGRGISVENEVLPLPHDEWPGDGDFTEVPPALLPQQWKPIVDAA